MDIKVGNMGVPTELDVWVTAFYNNTISLLEQFIKLGKTDNDLFYLDEEETIQSYSLNFKNNKDFDSSAFNDNYPKLKSLSIELDLFSVPKEYFDTNEWNAHYNDSMTELDGEILHNAEIYFELFISEEIFDVSLENLEEYLEDTNLKSYLMEYISHELTHMYEFYIRKVNGTDNIWIERQNNLVYNLMVDYLENIGMRELSSSWNQFMYLLYISAGFEINARIVQLYYRVMHHNSEVNSYESFMDIISDTLVNKEIESMHEFSPLSWYDDFEYDNDLADKYISNQEWITDEEQKQNSIKDLLIKGLILDLDYIIEILNNKGKDIKRIPIQYKENPLLFMKHYHKKIDKYHNKLVNKITRLYNKFI